MRHLWAIPAARGLFLLTLAGFASFSVSLGALPALVVLGGAPGSAAGLPTLVMLLATVVAQLLTPLLLRRIAPAILMLVGVLLLTLPALAFAAGTSLWMLLGVSAVRGLGFALLTVVGAYAMPAVVEPALRGRAIGLYGLAAALPMVLGPSIGAAMVGDGRDPAVLYLVVLLVGPVLTAPAVLWARGTPLEAGAHREGSVPQVIRRIALPCLVIFLATGATGGLLTVAPVMIAAPWLTTVVLVVFGAASVLSRWYAGSMVRPDALAGAARALVWACTVGLLGLALLLGQADRPTPTPAVVTGLVAAAVVLGVATGGMSTISLMASLHLSPTAPALVSAIWNVTFDAGTGIGAAAIAALAGGSGGAPAGFGGWALVAVAIGAAATMATPIRAGRAGAEPTQEAAR